MRLCSSLVDGFQLRGGGDSLTQIGIDWRACPVLEIQRSGMAGSDKGKIQRSERIPEKAVASRIHGRISPGRAMAGLTASLVEQTALGFTAGNTCGWYSGNCLE